MASISSVGIGSGVLTSSLIDKLIAAEKAPTEARLKRQETGINAEISVFGLLNSAITDIRLPSRTLANPSLYDSKSITSSSAAFSGVVDSTKAQSGSYSLEVTALANSQTLTTAEFNDSNTTKLGTGSLAITVGTTSATITIDNTNNTLDGIAAAINADKTIGATASVLYSGTGYKLVLNSDKTGLANKINIAVTDTGDANNTDKNGLSRLSYTSGALNLTESQVALDSAFKLNGVAVTRSSNKVSDAIPGITLSLNGTNAGAPASLVVAADNAAVVTTVKTFIEKFNAFQTLVNQNSAFDPTGATANGILLGDSTARTITTQLRRVLGSTVKGLEGASVGSLAEVGISTDFKTGLLSLNETKFNSALTANSKDVSALFSDQGRTTDSQVTFGAASVKTKPGTYAISVTTAGTRGDITGSVSLGASTTIDANNDNLTIKVDGTTSGGIVLTAGSYTQTQLVSEIQSKINADSALSSAGKSVTVSLNASNQIVINSNIYGASSKVEVTAVDTNTAAQLGLTVATGTTGVDIVGTINGKAATGSGQVLSAATGDDSEGINVTVAGSATGSRGNVTYIEGVSRQLVDLITSFVSVDGSLSSKNDTLTKQLAQIADERAKLGVRIKTLTTRLSRQFTAVDIIISKLNSTSDFITQQLNALSGTTTTSSTK